MISNNLETVISEFLKDNDYFDNTRNRTLVRSGFLNCRDGIVAFIDSLVTEANKKSNLTEIQLAAVATYMSLANQLRTYGNWVYVDNEPFSESSIDSSNSDAPEESSTADSES